MEKNEKDKIVKGRTPIKVGISIGDINGIGPEVIIKALSDVRILTECTPIVYGSSKTMSYHKKAINDTTFNFQRIDDAKEANNKKINIVSCWKEALNFDLGEPNETGGKYAFESLKRATEDLAAGKVDVLVTAPISKETIKKAGFEFPGHTEYLADLSGQSEALMMMVSKDMRVALVTSHIPLKEVSKAITKEKVIAKAKELNASLKKDFAIVKPKLAILGLNPHAGEQGILGEEEGKEINPAIQQLNKDGIMAFGPYPADGFFGSNQYKQFDGILAMYHDQGLSAFKALAFDDGVNFTAGLPIVRTSPDHGTAFDIAGEGIASGTSMRSAIYLAMDVFRNRAFVKEITTNPLAVSPPKQYKPRRKPEPRAQE